LHQAIDAGTFVDKGTEVNFTIASGHAPGDNSGPGSGDSGSGSDNSGEGSDSSGSGSGDPC
jgi:hypothetical protein